MKINLGSNTALFEPNLPIRINVSSYSSNKDRIQCITKGNIKVT